jgi:glycerol-3-phosphate dehydrogenase (NAD(P)+)
LSLAIIGGGSWGTALAVVLAPRFVKVRLWVHERDLCQRMAATRENDVFLPGIPLAEHVEPVNALEDAVAGASIVLMVTPSHHVRAVSAGLVPHLFEDMLFVSATKGLEQGTLLRMSQVLQAVIGVRFQPRIVVLSGPSFAREVAMGEPAAIAVASEDEDAAAEVQAAFRGPTFRPYRNTDPTGVEIGAALKNVIAIAAGVCHGLGFGSNAKAALITRGLAEITRLAVAMGGNPRTLAGLAGLGDLVLTCTGELSRNRRVGMELASGKPLAEILGGMKMVAEGVQTTSVALELARRYDVNLPITEQMEAILSGGKSPQAALRELMDRSLKGE